MRKTNHDIAHILEHVTDAFVALDGEWRYTYVNEKAARILGRRATDLIGKNIWEEFPEGINQKFYDAYHKAFRDQTPVTLEEYYPPFDRWFENRVYPFEDGLTIFFQDITQRKQVERDLRDAKEFAEAATRAKSEFVASMSHAIRTSMTAILGYTEMMLDPDQPSEERGQCIGSIQRSGDHLLAVVNDILELSKVEAGKTEIRKVNVSPSQLVVEVTSIMRPQVLAKNLSLDIDYAGSIPATIRTDPTRLRQILFNLIGNAIKFTEKGGVRLVIGMPSASSSTPPMLRFDVQDTGIGIEKGQEDKIFELFCQGDTPVAHRYGGTGLGLTIAKKLAQLLGGDLGFASMAGQGSTFTLSVATGPLEGVEMIDNPTEVQLPKLGPSWLPDQALNCSVLIAEDSPDEQQLIFHLLSKAGADVEVAENGKIAVDLALEAKAKGRPYDIILMDMQMPEMDGYTATRTLRKQGYTGTIAALTAHAIIGDREKCLQAGCDDYSSKPLDPTELFTMIATWTQPTRELTDGPDVLY